MKRRNDNDFRSNIELGGVGECYTADTDLITLCEKVAAVLQLDYCGIDVLTDNDGKRYICEVNSNAFFAEAERVCGVNVAKKYPPSSIFERKSLSLRLFIAHTYFPPITITLISSPPRPINF